MKSRCHFGENNPRAVVTDHDVSLAVELVTKHGLTQREVGGKFGVHQSTVQRWIRGSRRALRKRF